MGNDWKMASERNAPAPQAASLRFARVMGSLKLGGTVVGELRCVSCVHVACREEFGDRWLSLQGFEVA